MRVPRVTKTWRRGTLSLTPELCPTVAPSARTSVPMLTTEELTEAEIVRAVTGVVNDDSDECVDDSPELVYPMFRRPRKRWMRQTCCAASSALTMTARTDST
ncbi:hypothetical protein HPB52_001202 [Rhipicephalus sanguineus]|uniref:Uncharacterized protein n=1 Tax=Rhipicephalus sanguineus TaxID=34632 RepID=A0A9D4PTJ7_RHISA|nr:hypothetical protein HPB52_001202 [Rhipicephalus sanguineus]